MSNTNGVKNFPDSLDPVSPESIELFNKLKQSIVDQAVDTAMKNSEDLPELGEDVRSRFAVGMDFVMRMLEAAMMTFGEPAILEDEVSWALDRLTHDGVLPNHLVLSLTTLKHVIDQNMEDKHAEQINAYIDRMIHRIDQG